MRRGGALPVLLALVLASLLAVPAAMAHGQSIEVGKDVGKYHVIFYTFDLLSEGEAVRLAWNVTDRATGERVEVPNATLVQEDFDVGGKLGNRTTLNLTQRAAGFLFADVKVGGEGRAAFTVTLPPDAGQPTVQFDNHIYPASTPPGGVPIEGQGKPVSLPAALGLVALGLAALAARRR